MNVLRRIFGLLHRAYGPQGWWPGETDFEIAVGAVLTQNTAWGNVERAIANLRSAGKLDFASLRTTPDAEIERLIRPAGTYRVKTRRLRSLLEWMARACAGDLPRLRGEPRSRLRPALLEVHGVGPETADSILLYALHQPTFVIDAYTRRILSRHGLTRREATYAELQARFHADVPPDAKVYNEYHALLVRLAKEHCRARPRCDGCPLDCLGDAHRTALPLRPNGRRA